MSPERAGKGRPFGVECRTQLRPATASAHISACGESYCSCCSVAQVNGSAGGELARVPLPLGRAVPNQLKPELSSTDSQV